ncbi:MAG: hypothetical protein ACOC9T_01025 [Myxococcota bacterium]
MTSPVANPNPRLDSPEVIEFMKAVANGYKATGQKHDVSGAPTTTGFAHGPGGTFSFPGVDRTVLSTLVGTRPGVLSQIPTRLSQFVHPVYQVLTGVEEGGGAFPTDECSDPGFTPGSTKAGLLTSVFGHYRFSTQVFNVTRFGELNDRADPVDLQLLGDPMGENPFGPLTDPSTPAGVLQNEATKRLWELAIRAHRRLSQDIWTGQPSADDFRPMTGLETIINTGKVDAETGAALPSVDPQITDFDYTRIDEEPDEIVDAIVYEMRFTNDLAARTGVNQRGALFMREELFYELTKVWPCAYMTDNCVIDQAGGHRQTVDASDQIQMRDDMRRGRFLLVDGQQIPVIFDDGITEETDAESEVTDDCFASDIYWMPLGVNGFATLFMDAFDMGNEHISALLGQMPNANLQVSGNRYWLMHQNQEWTCVELGWDGRFRVVQRAPWLSWRIQNVQYCPRKHIRTPYPGDDNYVDGGVVERTAPDLESEYEPES